jgi:hypothetical protein
LRWLLAQNHFLRSFSLVARIFAAGGASPPGSCGTAGSVVRCLDLRQTTIRTMIVTTMQPDNDCDNDRDNDCAPDRPKATWCRRLPQHVHDSVATAGLSGASPAAPKIRKRLRFFRPGSQPALPGGHPTRRDAGLRIRPQPAVTCKAATGVAAYVATSRSYFFVDFPAAAAGPAAPPLSATPIAQRGLDRPATGSVGPPYPPDDHLPHAFATKNCHLPPSPLRAASQQYRDAPRRFQALNSCLAQRAETAMIHASQARNQRPLGIADVRHGGSDA